MEHRHDTPREGADALAGFPRDSGFVRESGFGHVPGQRWNSGYGHDVAHPDEGPLSGRGFAGNDFGSSRERTCAATNAVCETARCKELSHSCCRGVS